MFPTKPFLSDFIQLIYSNPIPLRLILILPSHLVREILGCLLFAVFQPKFAHAFLVSPSVLLVRSKDFFHYLIIADITNKRGISFLNYKTLIKTCIKQEHLNASTFFVFHGICGFFFNLLTTTHADSSLE